MTDSSKEQAVNYLWNQGTLFDLDIGRPNFQKKIRDKDVGLEDINEDAITLGHKKLLPKHAIKPLMDIESASRNYLKIHSLPFLTSGVRFVYYKALKDILNYLQAMQADWQVAVADLIKNYESLKLEQLKILDDEANKIRNQNLGKSINKFYTEEMVKWDAWYQEQCTLHRLLYPKIEDLPAMFKFSWRMFKITAADGLSTLGAMEQGELLEAQERLKKEMQQWVTESAAAIHKSLGEAAANAKTLLDKQGKINPKNLAPLFDAFEIFKAVDFTGSSEFQKKIDTLRAKFLYEDSNGKTDYGQTASAINNSPVAMETFKEMLGTLSELAVEEVAKKAGISALNAGEYKRLIEV